MTTETKTKPTAPGAAPVPEKVTKEIDMANMLINLLARQTSYAVDETADELAKFFDEGRLLWSARVYTALAENLAEKAKNGRGGQCTSGPQGRSQCLRATSSPT